ncbi:MAG: T9SS type A sorting domain-containing protein [Candidatus Kapabacteria bacterium]|nr:T9SS type A sorting domain-containing protein [Candidatus Kapabacteria bacterium]
MNKNADIIMMKIIFLLCYLAGLAITANAQQYSVLYNFSNSSGYYPDFGGLVYDGTYLYGDCYNGGANGVGTLFKIHPDGSGFTKLFDFSSSNGANPSGNNIVISGSLLYGMTEQGGINNCGVIFKINNDGSGYSKILDFEYTNSGRHPHGNVILINNVLYGLAYDGGTGTWGTIFKINTDGSGFTKLHEFTSNPDGAHPYSDLIYDGNSLFGTTSEGGSNGVGTIFKISTDGTGYTKIYDFNAPQGEWPYCRLLNDGNILYGMTDYGTTNLGVIFRINKDGSNYTVLHDYPLFRAYNGLIKVDTTLYGLTYSNSDLFKMNLDGSGFSYLYRFPDGHIPLGTLLSINNVLYGMTQRAGANNLGLIFKFNLTSITTSSITPTTYCSGSSISIPFTITGTFNSSYTFTAQLSDASGNFSSPTAVGTLVGTSAGTISGTIPRNTPAGTAYRVRVVSSDPAVTGSDNGANITINALPTFSITGPSSVCANAYQTFSGTSIAGRTYKWLAFNGTIQGVDNTTNVGIVWGSQSSGTVSLIETINATGCTDTVFQAVTINPLPTPAISGTFTLCEKVQDDYSTPNISGHTYKWYATNSTIQGSSTNNNVDVLWGSAPSATIKVVETITATGCKDSTFQVITLNPVPHPALSGPNSVCATNTYSYSSNSASPVEDIWTATNGTIQGSNTNQTVNITWPTAGSATLTLKQDNSITGCESTTFVVITVNPLPAPSITGTLTVCPNNISAYSVGSVANHTYQWTIIPPTSGTFSSPSNVNSVNVNWVNTSSATIQCTVTNQNTGCVNSDYKLITINPLPVKPDIAGPNPACVANEYTYTATDIVGTTLSWSAVGGTVSPSSGPSVKVKWASVGTGSVKAKRTNVSTNCSDSSSLSVAVSALPNKSISGLSSVPKGSTQSYSGPTDATTWQWIVSSGGTIMGSSSAQIVNIQWGAAGTEKITLYVTNAAGCRDSITLDITINNSNIVINNYSANICEFSSSKFSVAPAANRTNEWSAQGGNPIGSTTDTLFNVKWGAAGQGSVTLIQTISGNLKDTASISVTIHQLPKPKISGPITALNQALQTYTAALATNNTYKWTASGGAVQGKDNSSSVDVLWGAGTSGKVILTQTNEFDCSSQDSLSVTLSNKPGLSITGTQSLCEGRSADYKTTTPNGATSKWSVNSFGQIIGQNTGDQITVNWTSKGAGKVKLIQEDKSKGFLDSTELTVTVNPMPKVSIGGFLDICMDAGAFDLTSGFPVGGNYSGAKGINGTKFDPLSAGAGSHTITYSYTTPEGCSDSVWKSFTVHPLPAKPNISEKDSTLYSDAPSGNQWFYQDTLIPGATAASYKPTKEGIYDCEVTDANGCKARAAAGHYYPSGGKNPAIVANTSIKYNNIICTSISTDTLLVQNYGVAPLMISSIDFGGTNKDEFAAVKDYSNTKIDSMGKVQLLINFVPKTTGQKTANLTINSNASNNAKFNVTLTGSKDSSGFVLDSSKVYYRNLPENLSSTQDLGITNTGSIPIFFAFPITIDIKFKILSIDPNPIPPNSSGILTFRYAGAKNGTIDSAKYKFTEPNCGNGTQISLFANVGTPAIKGFAIFHVDSTESDPGGGVLLKIYLDTAHNIDNVKGYKFDLSFNKTLLVPFDKTPNGKLSDSINTVTLALPALAENANYFKAFDFIATLGNDTLSELKATNPTAIGDTNVKVTVKNGLFTLTGLCREGGHPRLLSAGTTAKLMIGKPNPGNDKIEIDYELIEDGMTKMALVDNAGQEVKVVFNQAKKAGTGSEQINISDLHSGTYFLVLKTETMILTKKIEVVK